MNETTFTIQSTGAALVEADAAGPATDAAGGLAVADGVATIAPVDLLDGPVRFFRVAGHPSVTAKVRIIDSPLGALLTVRRCEASEMEHRARGHRELLAGFDPVSVMPVAIRGITKALWIMPVKDAVAVLVQAAPIVLGAFNAGLVAGSPSCDWADVIDKSPAAVDVQGGDILVVAFEVP